MLQSREFDMGVEEMSGMSEVRRELRLRMGKDPKRGARC